MLQITYLGNNDEIRTESLNKIPKIKNKAALDVKVNNWLQDYLKGKKKKVIGLYYPLKNEPDIKPTIKYLIDNKFQVFLPWMSTKINCFKQIQSIPFVANSFNGVQQPLSGKTIGADKIDILICPCIAFKENYRLGYGSNFYNSLFANNKTTTKVILAYKIQENPAIVIKPSYIKFDLVKVF
jgi:5,10-methenyltetrahydrofolate synthetase